MSFSHADQIMEFALEELGETSRRLIAQLLRLASYHLSLEPTYGATRA